MWRRTADIYPASKPSARRLRKRESVLLMPSVSHRRAKKWISLDQASIHQLIPIKNPPHATFNPNRLWRRPADTYNQLTKPAYKTACGGVPPIQTTNLQNQHTRPLVEASRRHIQQTYKIACGGVPPTHTTNLQNQHTRPLVEASRRHKTSIYTFGETPQEAKKRSTDALGVPPKGLISSKGI